MKSKTIKHRVFKLKELDKRTMEIRRLILKANGKAIDCGNEISIRRKDWMEILEWAYYFNL